MSEHEVVVIGAGISGMSFARACAQRGIKALVLEKRERAGGCIQSRRLDSGFWFELGAHTCYNSYGQLLKLLEAGPGLSKLIPRAKVPFRLFVDGEIRSIGRELSVLRLLASAPRLVTTRKTNRTVRDYYGRLVGARNYSRVFGPLFAAVPSQPADDFPAEMLFKARERRKDVLRSFTLRGGLSSVIEALSEHEDLTVRTGAEATALARDGSGFTVTLSDGERIGARFVALALPPPAAAALTREAFPAVSQPLAEIKASAIATVGVVLRTKDTPVEPVAGIIPVDGRFYSAVSRDTVPDPDWRGFAFHSKPGTSLTDRLALAAGVLKTDRSKFEHVAEREVVLPSPTLGHAELARRISEAAAGTPLFVTGNYFGGLAIEDCVIRSVEEATRLAEMRQP